MSPMTPDLGINHVQVIVRAMYAVAKADGVHDAELVMLRGFYDDCARATNALTSFDQLLRIPFDEMEAARILDNDERRSALLQSCVMLAYADGRYSAGERACVRAFADALGMAPAALATLEAAVADSLMAQLAKVSNLDALREVAAETSSRD